MGHPQDNLALTAAVFGDMFVGRNEFFLVKSLSETLAGLGYFLLHFTSILAT